MSRFKTSAVALLLAAALLTIGTQVGGQGPPGPPGGPVAELLERVAALEEALGQLDQRVAALEGTQGQGGATRTVYSHEVDPTSEDADVVLSFTYPCCDGCQSVTKFYFAKSITSGLSLVDPPVVQLVQRQFFDYELEEMGLWVTFPNLVYLRDGAEGLEVLVRYKYAHYLVCPGEPDQLQDLNVHIAPDEDGLIRFRVIVIE
jgi:hypothetical protein